MRIAVLADTHVSGLESIGSRIVDAISTVDLIFHAGDFTDLQTLMGLKGFRNEVIDGVLLFNPGTATESFGILTVDDGVVKGEIVSSRQEAYGLPSHD